MKKIAAVLCVSVILLSVLSAVFDDEAKKGQSTNPQRAQTEMMQPETMQSEVMQTTAVLSDILQPETGQPAQMEEINPERVFFIEPYVELNGEEGVISYRWGLDCISVDETTVLISCDCYFPEQKLQQKIFYLAKTPDFMPEEVFRQDSRSGFEGVTGVGENEPELFERRLHHPLAVDAGYIYELDGELYCLSENFQKTALICDMRELMGELYEFSPWEPEENICDVASDGSRMLTCTDEGLYEYDLPYGEKRLLEPAVFTLHEIGHIEGDCDCGETGFDFSGPIEAEYAPDGQGYAFMTGTEYGGPLSVTLRDEDDKTIYSKELKNYEGGFKWLEAENKVFLAVFYREDEATWMDRVDADSGEKETFTVPDEVFYGSYPGVDFLDSDSIIYCKKIVSAYLEENEGIESEYEIYRLSGGESQKPEAIAGDVNWRIKTLRPGGYGAIIVKLPK